MRDRTKIYIATGITTAGILLGIGVVVYLKKSGYIGWPAPKIDPKFMGLKGKGNRPIESEENKQMVSNAEIENNPTNKIIEGDLTTENSEFVENTINNNLPGTGNR